MLIWTALRGSQNSSVALSQVKNHGFWSTTPETKRQNREWHTADPKSNRCSFDMGSSTRTHCQSKFLSGSPCVARARPGITHTLGCSTTTMPHVTWQSPSMDFWQKKAFLWFLSPPVCWISVPVTSFYSAGSKTT